MSKSRTSTRVDVAAITKRAKRARATTPAERRLTAALARGGWGRRGTGAKVRREVLVLLFAQKVEELTGRQVTPSFLEHALAAIVRGTKIKNERELEQAALESIPEIERRERLNVVSLDEYRARRLEARYA